MCRQELAYTLHSNLSGVESSAQVLGYLVFTFTKLATHISKVAVAASHRKRGVASALVQVLPALRCSHCLFANEQKSEAALLLSSQSTH